MNTVEIIVLVAGAVGLGWLAGQRGVPFRLPGGASAKPPTASPVQNVATRRRDDSPLLIAEDALGAVAEHFEMRKLDRLREDGRAKRVLAKVEELRATLGTP